MKKNGVALTFGGLLLLSACASENNTAADANLSPAEQVLQHHGTNTALTAAEGTGIGAAGGCLIGFLAAGTGGCVKGAIVGGVGGLAAGLYVASRAEAAKETEDQYAHQIVQADADAQSAQKVADASQTIANEAAQKISALKAQLRSQQITLDQYNQQVAHYQNDRNLLVQNITEEQKHLASTNYLISSGRGTYAQKQQLAQAKLKLQAAIKQQQAEADSMQELAATS